MKQALYILAVISAMGLCILDTNQNIKNSDELQSKLEQDTYTVYVNGEEVDPLFIEDGWYIVKYDEEGKRIALSDYDHNDISSDEKKVKI